LRQLPAVAIIVPVYNEEQIIGRTLEQLAAQQPEELVIADGGSTDNTVARVSAEIAAGCQAKLVISEKGRGRQMNAGAAAVEHAEVLWFLHADVIPRQDALRALRRVMADPGVVGGNCDVLFEGGDRTAGVFTRINRLRSRMGIFYGDSGIFCRRDIFTELGGYRDLTVMEDYDFAKRLRRSGRLAFSTEPLYVSARRWRRAGLLSTLWSWFWVQGLYSAGVPASALSRWYRDVR
jgi:rSAM/selenodomain-associated transferase 2